MDHDLFVLNAERDEAWVLGYFIPSLGLQKERIITPKDFQLGFPIAEQFERFVRNSRFIVLVLSGAFIADKWAKFAEQIASFLSVVEQRTRLIPLVLEDCELPLHIDFLVKLDCRMPAAWTAELSRLRVALKCAEPEEEKIPCPYIGMVPFSTSDADYFYGREREIDEVVRHFRDQRFLFIIGPSGAGKSSLIFAGLIPALKRAAPLFSHDFWCFRNFRPGSKPLEKLREALAGDLREPAKDLARLLAVEAPAQRVLIFIDQFEEVFAQCGREDQMRFFAAIQALRNEQTCALVLTMRANFYADLMRSEIWEAIKSQRLEVTPLRGKALRTAIESPANKVKVFLDARLVDQLLVDAATRPGPEAASEPGVLPLMQEAMILLWSKLEKRYLSLGIYEQLGRAGRSGLAVAVASKAEAAVLDLNPEGQTIARRILLRLIQFGQGRPDTRRQQKITFLRNASDDREKFDDTLSHLINRRLLTSDAEPVNDLQTDCVSGWGDATIDLAHEALIVGWPRLQKWIVTRRESEQPRRRLEAKAEEFAGRVRQGLSGGFLDETELLEAERWLGSEDGTDLGSSDDLLELINASRADLIRVAQEKEAARERDLKRARSFVRKLTAISAALGISLVLAVGGILAAGRMNIITTIRRLAAEGTSRLENKPDQALLLSVTAAEKDRKLSLMESVSSGFEQIRELFFGRFQSRSLEVESSLLTGLQHTGYVAAFLHGNQSFIWDIAVSPDGKTAATAGADGTITLWDLDTYQVRQKLLTESKALYGVVFSRDGNLLAAAGAAGKVFFWNARTWETISQPIVNRDGWVMALAISPNGKYLAWSNSLGNTITIWNIAGNRPLYPALEGHSNVVDRLAFSPDGSLLASGSRDTRAAIWDIRSGNRLGDWLNDHTDPIYGLCFSPDGKQLATASADKTIIIWDVSTQSALGLPLRGHTSTAWRVQYSRDGSKLASCGVDGTVRLWNARTGTQIGQAFTGHRGQINGISFTPDGKLLISAGWDRNIIVWNAEQQYSVSRRLVKHPGSVRTVGALRNPNAFLSVDDRGSVSLGQTNAEPSTFELLGNELTESYKAVSFSPDGSTLATGGASGIVTLWDYATRRPIGTLRGHSGEILSTAFSPTGDVLASASDDGTIALWDPAKRIQIGPPLIGHLGDVMELVFSPDGSALFSTGDDFTVIRWDIKSREYSRCVGHSGSVSALAISRDGKMLVSAANDGNVKFWSADTCQLIKSMPFLNDKGNSFNLYSAAFSPDGKSLAVAGGTEISFWELKSQERISRTFHSQDGDILDIKFSPDGSILAAACDKKTVELWDIKSGRVTRLGQAHTAKVNKVAFSKDGRLLASASEDEKVVLWNVQKKVPDGEPLHGDNKEVETASINPDGTVLAMGHKDGTISLWDVARRKMINSGFKAFDKELRTLAFSPDGEILGTGAVDDGTVKLWKVAAQQLVSSWKANEGTVQRIAFSPDRETLATADLSGSIRLWNLTTQGAIGQPLKGHDGLISALVFSPDGKSLASGGQDRRIVLWDVATQHQRGAALVSHTGTVWTICFSPDGKTLASGGDDRKIALWDVSSQEAIGSGFFIAATVNSLAFSFDGHHLYSGASDGAITDWNLVPADWAVLARKVANRELTSGESD